MAKGTLHLLDCFTGKGRSDDYKKTVVPHLIHEATGKPSPLTIAIQSDMNGYKLSPLSAIQRQLSQHEKQYAEIEKSLDEHAANNRPDRRVSQIPMPESSRSTDNTFELPHEADVIANKAADKLIADGIHPDHAGVTNHRNDRREEERIPDRETGLIERRHHDPMVERAFKIHTATGIPAAYFDADVHNLTALNKLTGGTAEANVHYKAISAILRDTVAEVFPNSHTLRKGGDELAGIVPGATKKTLTEVLEKAQDKIEAYAEANGLSNLKHTKEGKAPGFSLDFGISDFSEASTPEDVVAIAEGETVAAKIAVQEAHDVAQKQARPTRISSLREQTRGTKEGTGFENARTQIQKNSQVDVFRSETEKAGAVTSGGQTGGVDGSIEGKNEADEKAAAGWWGKLKPAERGALLKETGSLVPRGATWEALGLRDPIAQELISKKLGELSKAEQNQESIDNARIRPEDIYGTNTDWQSVYASMVAPENNYFSVVKGKGKPATDSTFTKHFSQIYPSLFDNSDPNRPQANYDKKGIQATVANLAKGKPLEELTDKQRDIAERIIADEKNMQELMAAMSLEELTHHLEDRNDYRESDEIEENSERDASKNAEGSLEESRGLDSREDEDYDYPIENPFDDPFSTDEEKAGWLAKGNVAEQFSLFGANQLDLDFRKGTTDADKQRAIDLLNSLSGTTETDGQIESGKLGENRPAGRVLGPRRRTPSLLANAISAAFRTKGVFNFVGQQINSPGDLAAIAQVYRNPSFETLRYFFTKNGVITGHTGVSSRLPGISAEIPTSSTMNTLAWVKAQMAAYGADGYWLVHNHPSGDVTASKADLAMQSNLTLSVPGFQGHIIINHNKYGLLSVGIGDELIDFKEIQHSFTADEDHIHKPSIPHPILGKKISDSGDLVSTSYQLQIKNGYVLIVGTSGKNGVAHVSSLLEIPADTPKAKFAFILRRFANQTGSTSIFAVLPEKTAEGLSQDRLDELRTWAAEAVHNGFLRDAIDERGHSALSIMGGVPGKNIFGKPLKGYEVGRTETTSQTPELFQSAFGFRGVEFGNSMPAGERQHNLNQTFDALHDLSNILGIPTQAISLNGELGLAFRARGHGGERAPSAHYEPDKIVINLTREHGAGSLAHEWFHAIDSYLSRQRGYPKKFITDSPVKYGPNDATRQELIDAFKKLSGALNDTNLRARSRNLDKTRSKDYWSTGIEMHARAFENYVIDKLAADNKNNDYLANVKGVDAYAEDLLNGLMSGKTVNDLYPYLLPNEIEKVSNAFDNLFATMETKQTDKGMAVYEEQGEYGKPKSEPSLAEKRQEYHAKAEEAFARDDFEEMDKWIAKANALVETASLPKRTTAVKNAVTEEEQGPQNKWTFTKEGIIEEGKKAVDSGDTDPRTLAKQIISDPHRMVSPEEQASLLYDRTKLHNEHAKLTEKYIAATERGDEKARAELRYQRDEIEKNLEINAQAATYIGTSWSAFGHARQAVMAQDYSLSYTLQRVRAATGKSEIPEAVRTRIEQLTKDLAEAEKKMAEYEQRLHDAESTRKAKVVVERIRLTDRPDKRGSDRKAVDAEFKSLAGKLRGMLGRVNMGLDPGVVLVLGQMAKNRVAAGIKNAEEIINDIKLELSDIPELEKRDIRDAISGYGKTSHLSQEELDVDLREARRQMRLISALEDAEAGESPLKSGQQRDPVTDEVRELQRLIKDAMREHGTDDKPARTDEERWKTSSDAIKTRLKNEIRDLDAQIKMGKRVIKDRNTVNYDEEANQLKAIRDEKKALLESIDAKPPKSEEELQKVALKAYKTRTAARIIEIERKLATGDFSKKARRILNMDPDAMKLKTEVAKAKADLDAAIEAERLKNRTKLEVALDWTHKIRRAIILSGSATLGKLTLAATMRAGVTPMESAIATILSYTPGLRDIAKNAPREGRFSWEGEKAALSALFSKETIEDMKRMAKEGKSSIDLLYGKKHDAPPEVIELFGRLHGMLKVGVKRAEFYRSLQMRTEHAISNGLDVTRPEIQAMLGAAAYIDANRAILMDENMAVDAWKMLLASLDRNGSWGKVAAATARFIMPIVKIPANFVAEASQYAAGAPQAAWRYYDKRKEGLTPDDNDYIMRSLKKQGMGMAFMSFILLLSAMGLIEAGGYYEMGEKREKGEPKAGGLKLFGWDVPKWALHTPLFEMMQITATVQNLIKKHEKWNKDPKHRDDKKSTGSAAVAAGLYNAGIGLAEEVPFVGTTEKTLSKLRNSDSFGKWFGETAAGAVVPPDVRKIARAMDKAGEDEVIPRKAGNPLEQIMLSVPGARNTLEVDVNAFKRMPLSKAKDIYDHAPYSVRIKLEKAYRAKEERYQRYGAK